MKCAACSKKMILPNKMIDGYICDDCLFSLPHSLNKATIAQVKELISHKPQNPFVATMNYGDLYIDSNTMQFTVKEQIKKGTTNSNYVFRLSDIRQIEIIYKGRPKVNQYAVGPVEVIIGLKSPKITLKTIIKKNVKSPLKMTNNNVITWLEPKELAFFKKQLSDLIEDSLKNSCSSDNRISIFDRAKIAFYLDDYYTEEDVKLQRNRLLKVFHQDEGEINAKYSQMINNYYDILLEYLEKQKK